MEKAMKSTTIAVLLAEGFEEIEAVTIIDVLRRAGLKVLVTGTGKSQTVTGAHSLEVGTDCLLAKLDPAALSGVVLPGGLPGATNLAGNPAVIQLLRDLQGQKKLVGAICAAPLALSAAGLLDGRRVTAYPGIETSLPGAIYTAAAVEMDGNLVTGKGPGTALDFAFKLVEQLCGPAKTRELRSAMLHPGR
jgi:4-methyl-5(b-hydroxyethyl)-thiazole monophosphate biosynthesis